MPGPHRGEPARVLDGDSRACARRGVLDHGGHRVTVTGSHRPIAASGHRYGEADTPLPKVPKRTGFRPTTGDKAHRPPEAN